MQGITLSVYRSQNTIADTILEEGHAMQQSKFGRHLAVDLRIKVEGGDREILSIDSQHVQSNRSRALHIPSADADIS